MTGWTSWIFKTLTRLLNPDFLARSIKGDRAAIILLYHSPTPTLFEKHIEYLHERYNFISLETLISAMENDDWESLPQNALVVTFDDGWASNYDLLPTIKEFKLHPTIYLCTQVVGTSLSYWWHDVPTNELKELKKLSNQQRIERLRKDYPATFQPRQSISALNYKMIEEMRPFVAFESHTRNHPIITTLTDSELPEEIEKPLEDLAKLGIKSSHFAYPNGDYSNREVEYLKNHQYRSARTTDVGWVNNQSDRFQLKTMGISDHASVEKMRWQISGIFGWLLYLLSYGNLSGKKEVIKLTADE